MIRGIITVQHFDAQGKLLSEERTHNLITDAGLDWLCGIMGDAAGLPAKYIAISSDVTPPTALDTELLGEWVDSGLERALGTYAHDAGTDAFTVSKQFTYMGVAPITIQKAGLFTEAVAGIMVAAGMLATPKTLETGEQVNIVWNRDLGLIA